MDGWVTIGTKLDTKEFDAQIKETEAKLNDLEASLQMASEDKTLFSTREIREMEAEVEKLKNKLVDLRKKQSDVGKVDLSGISSAMNNVIKKVTRWTLAIFGVRSAYSAIRSAISTISQYNEQFATDLEYIRYAMANALLPVIEKIVNWVKLLLTYINYIWKAWFGKELFASAKSFSNMQKSASGTAKAVKEIKKQLAGFDEMNVLNADGSTSAGGVPSGISAPSFDLGDFDKVKIPKWVQWIADNKDIVLGFFKGLALAIAGIKLAKLLSDLGLFGQKLSGIQTLIKGLGFAAAIYGVITAIQSLFAYFKDPSWENFGDTIKGIGIAILGVGVVIGNLPLALIGGAVALVGIVIKYWDEIKGILLDVVKWLESKTDWVYKHFGIVGGLIYETIINLIKNIVKSFDEIFTGLKKILDGIIEFIKGIFSGDWKRAWEGIQKIFEGFLNTIKGLVDLTWGSIKAVVSTIANWINQHVVQPIVNFFKSGFSMIGGFFVDIGIKAKEIFGNVKDTIKNALSPENFKEIGNKLLNWFSSLWENIKNGAKKAWDKVKSWFGLSTGGVVDSGFTGGGGGSGFAKGGVTGFANGGVGTIKMAAGSIISQPGRGVPMSRAIGGEAGHEGIIPLTNAQMMSQLGEEIAKYVSIPITNIIKMDSRQIARYQNKANSRSDFAFNK